MKYILAPNPKPPYNLRKISLPYGSRNLHFESEQAMIDYVVARNKEVGVIPCESEAELTACLIAYEERHQGRDVPPLVLPPVGPHYIVDETELPDHDFFDCWEWNNGCNVNMPKARTIHMDCIRKVRNAELEKLDVPFLRAVEAGDTAEQQRIARKKQTLRDIPQTFDLSSIRAPEALKAAWPNELPASDA